MDYEDMNRILTQLLEDEPNLFKDWIESNYCPDCSLMSRRKDII